MLINYRNQWVNSANYHVQRGFQTFSLIFANKRLANRFIVSPNWPIAKFFLLEANIDQSMSIYSHSRDSFQEFNRLNIPKRSFHLVVEC